jgi:DNA-binding CsgD family transcriptional regulator
MFSSNILPGNALAEEDVRAVVRLLADVAVLEGDLADKKQALMQGLQELIDADGWLWSITHVEAGTRVPICTGLMHSGLTEDQLTGWLEASQSACPPPEDEACFELVQTGKHFTRTRQQLVSDADWYSHPAVIRHRLQRGIDHFLYSVYPLEDPDMFSAIGFFRSVGRPPFSERQSRIAHILLSEVEWLHYAELPGERGRKVPQLSPRQRVVLIMLVEAHDKDKIADLLHLSPHTVKDYMKAIYKHFGVSSQLELIHRFRFGDCGDESRGDETINEE